MSPGLQMLFLAAAVVAVLASAQLRRLAVFAVVCVILYYAWGVFLKTTACSVGEDGRCFVRLQETWQGPCWADDGGFVHRSGSTYYLSAPPGQRPAAHCV